MDHPDPELPENGLLNREASFHNHLMLQEKKILDEQPGPWGDSVGRGGNSQTIDPLSVASSSCFILYPSRKALVSWQNHLLRSLTG